MSDAAVWIDPARRSGEPCIHGTRIPVDLVIGLVWAHGVAEAEGTYDLSRQQVLGACWFAGAGYNLRGPWRKRWREWADKSHQAMWEGRWDDVRDPPTKGDAP